MKTASLAGAALAALLFGPCVAPPARAGEPLLYHVAGGQIVFTNIPSTPDVRPLPGFVDESVPVAPRPPLRPRAGGTFESLIAQVSEESGVSSSLIQAVAQVESGFNPRAVSPKGAQGLMQLMPGTARRYGVQNAFDPYDNLRAGATHLRSLLDEFDGDLSLALAAYNAGSGAVRRHGGIPAYRETREYVRKVRQQIDGSSGSPVASGSGRPGRSVQLLRLADGSVKLVN